MNLSRHSELYRRCYRKWGIGAQVDMVVEECSELIQAISKGKRKGLSEVQVNLTEELVDVEIMVEQLKVIMSDHFHSFDHMYMNKREQKIERLKGLLQDEVPDPREMDKEAFI